MLQACIPFIVGSEKMYVFCQEVKMFLCYGQVPLCHLLMFKKFLSLPNHSIKVCGTGKRINHEAEYEL